MFVPFHFDPVDHKNRIVGKTMLSQQCFNELSCIRVDKLWMSVNEPFSGSIIYRQDPMFVICDVSPSGFTKYVRHELCQRRNAEADLLSSKGIIAGYVSYGTGKNDKPGVI